MKSSCPSTTVGTAMADTRAPATIRRIMSFPTLKSSSPMSSVLRTGDRARQLFERPGDVTGEGGDQPALCGDHALEGVPGRLGERGPPSDRWLLAAPVEDGPPGEQAAAPIARPLEPNDVDDDLAVDPRAPGPREDGDAIRGNCGRQVLGERLGEGLGEGRRPVIELREVELRRAHARHDL